MGLIAKDVYKRFGKQLVLGGVSLAMPERGCVALVGPSGSGKTTLLRVICGLEKPERGTVALGSDILTSGDTFVPPHLRRTAMVFQDLGLWPHLTCRQHVLLSARSRGRTQMADAYLSRFRIAGLANKRPEHLSGGERQRLALARAVASDPAILILDEPFSQLDAQLRHEVIDEVRAVSEEIPVLLVSHDYTDISSLAANTFVLEKGYLAASRTPSELYSHPRSHFEAALFGSYTTIDLDSPLRSAFNLHSGDKACSEYILRPSMIEIDEKGPIRSKVVSCIASGPNHLLEVDINGTRLTLSSQEPVSIGSETTLRLRAQPAVLHNSAIS